MLIDNFFITFIIILFVFKLKKDKITIFIAIILNLSHIRLHKYFLLPLQSYYNKK